MVGFQPKNKSKKKKVRAAQSFRQALQRRKNDPLWIYKHDFENDVIDNLESKMEERKRKAVILVQRTFRGRMYRRDLEAQRSYDPVDISVLFREERLGIRFEDMYGHHPLHLPKDSRHYHVCVTDFDPESEYAKTVRLIENLSLISQYSFNTNDQNPDKAW